MLRSGRALRVALVVLLAGSALVASGCSDDTSSKAASSKKSTTSTTTAPSTTATATTVADGTPTTTAAGPAGAGATTTVPVAGRTAPPVAIDQTAAFGDGVTARLSKLQAINATATLPGETSGPAVAVTVEVTNGTTAPVDVGNVTVDLATADGVSASPVTTDPSKPLAGELPAGQSRSGVYVFRVPAEARSDVDVRVKYSADTPIVIFAGSVPNA